ncbi:MAG: hypothetical protein JSV88_20500 [Candidatus Aminicenantes bacterium]|nr:MAG: hypothetical protein JSV88_20500 [Candidatus Aminicenantes bacterium]
MRRSKLLLVVILMFGISALANAQCTNPWCYVGGYHGTDWGNTIPPVDAFLTNMAPGSCVWTTDGPFAANVAHWDTYNNYDPSFNFGIDWYEFVYSCEHGAPWKFWVNDGIVDLENIGDPVINPSIENDGGWGDWYTNWVVIYSCSVVCSPIEKPTNWMDPWIKLNPYCVFHADSLDNHQLHIVNGFRTPAYVAPAVTVSTYYAQAIRDGVGQVLWEWFYNVWVYSYCSSTSYDKACSVYYASCHNDTLSSYAADPPATGDLFSCWYF